MAHLTNPLALALIYKAETPGYTRASFATIAAVLESLSHDIQGAHPFPFASALICFVSSPHTFTLMRSMP
jgi:hypothetical protein